MTEVTGLAPLPLEQWPDRLKHVIDDMQGRPLNIHALIANNPDLLESWWSLRQHVVPGGTLSPRLAELAILRVAALTDCSYEWASHVVRGEAAGLTLEEIERVKMGSTATDWEPDDAILLQAIEELHERNAIAPETLVALGRSLAANQVLDLVAVYGVYRMLAGFLNTWSTPLDTHVAEHLADAMESD